MIIETIGPFLDYYEGFRSRTLRVARAIPPESLEWTYRQGRWTLGDLLRHLAAAERFMFAENVRQRPSIYPGHGRELAEGYDQVLAFVERLHRESVEIFSALTSEDLARRCRTPGGIDLPAWKWLRAMVEHEAHHRGQIYLYLALLGVETPPLYGLTEEEVLLRSAPPDGRRPS